MIWRQCLGTVVTLAMKQWIRRLCEDGKVCTVLLWLLLRMQREPWDRVGLGLLQLRHHHCWSQGVLQIQQLLQQRLLLHR